MERGGERGCVESKQYHILINLTAGLFVIGFLRIHLNVVLIFGQKKVPEIGFDNTTL